MLCGLTTFGCYGCRKRAESPQTTYAHSVDELKRGNLNNALEQTQAALNGSSDTSSEWHYRLLALRGEVLMRKGLYAQSLSSLEFELPSTLRSTDIEVWRQLTRGADYFYRQDFARAQACLSEAQSLAETNHLELLGEVALRQGTLADLRDDTRSASEFYRKALQMARDRKDSYLEVASVGNLGMLAMEEERYDESIDWGTQALRLSESAGDQVSVAKTLLNMSWSYVDLGDYERALDVLQLAQESTHKAGLVNDELICQINLAAIKRYVHDTAAAEQIGTAALNLARKLDAKRSLVETLNVLTSVMLDEANLHTAASYNREALEVSRSIKDHAAELVATLEAARVADSGGDRKSAESLLLGVIDDKDAATAARWEAQARLAKVYDGDNEPVKALAEYAGAIRTIQSARKSIKEEDLRLAFLSSSIDFYDDYIDFLIQHRRVEDALLVADLTRSQTLIEGLTLSANKSSAHPATKQSPLELARKLHATLLIYWLGQNHSYLWVATPAKLSYFPLPPKSQIDPVVKTYRQSILDGRDVLGANDQAGQQLFRMLVAPAQTLIPHDSRAILFPAESLYGLNFESLIVPGPAPHFWIEDVTLSTASALAMPPSTSHPWSVKQRSLLLVGNPEPASADFPRLAQAPAEMQKISSHFPQPERKVLEGPQATPASYLSCNPGRFSYLHFVTHGTASHTRPLESAVILSKVGDSYKLYARDILKDPLSANLVTISACNGAGTRAYAGEGLVGLSWAFLRAGAHNVIGALWEVSDATSTPQLMDSLYSGLDQGQDPATALRNAKLGLLHSSGDSVFKKPFYWAPFQLYSGS